MKKDILKAASSFLVLALMVIALAVAMIQSRAAVQSGGVWYLIAAYWLVLTAKNMVDFLGITGKEKATDGLTVEEAWAALYDSLEKDLVVHVLDEKMGGKEESQEIKSICMTASGTYWARFEMCYQGCVETREVWKVPEKIQVRKI